MTEVSADRAVRSDLSPQRILSALLRFWYVVLAAAVVGGVLAFLYSSTLAPIYRSSASIYFSMRSATSGSDINQGSAYTQNQMLSFAQLAMSALVLDSVRDELSQPLTNNELRTMTSVSIPQNTVILEISAASTEPEFAAEVANGIAGHLATSVDAIAPRDQNGDTTVVARVVDPAVAATVQSSPNKQRDALFGAVAGGLIAALAISIWALLDTRVRSQDVLRRVTDLPLLGAIPRAKDKLRRAVVFTEPNGVQAEAYRHVHSSLRFAAVEHEVRSIAITSSVPTEGKTTAAVNLALTYAEAGMRVVIVDADLRRPIVAQMLGVENAVGLTTLLVRGIDLQEAVLRWGETSLWVLPAGEVPPNPAELLASSRMAEIVAELIESFDMVVIDTAPLLAVADAATIAQYVDATVVIADVTKVRAAQLSRTLSTLSIARAQIAGVVLSRVKRPRRDSYYYSSSKASPGLRRNNRSRGSRGRAGKPPAPDSGESSTDTPAHDAADVHARVD